MRARSFIARDDGRSIVLRLRRGAQRAPGPAKPGFEHYWDPVGAGDVGVGALPGVVGEVPFAGPLLEGVGFFP